MRTTKRQLRRIIKEEKARLLSEMSPDVEEGISRGVQNGVWNYIEEEFSQDMIGEDVWINPIYVESIAHALEVVAREVRQSKTIPPEEHHTSPATRNRR
ncbi:MAG: hypothetical protein CME70_19175 [Halobacteriovorax sp.]|nr:hypothetical protein [Halobacteriovorax sp.]|tara:strand:- start:112 stop:408 length:297 start_codon:yes stop_codon:yes gene_type:complete